MLGLHAYPVRKLSMFTTWAICGKRWHSYVGIRSKLQLQPIFWHHEFGHARALNDLNIWDPSQLHESFIGGTFGKIDFDFEINGEQFTNLYFLVDGIYPELSHFVKTISVPVSLLESKFAKWQESVRKNIERGFGVLSKKFKFMQTLVRLHYVDDIFYVVKLCICLHNEMVVHCIENREDPETEDMYNITTNTENSLELDEEEVRDSAQIAGKIQLGTTFGTEVESCQQIMEKFM